MSNLSRSPLTTWRRWQARRGIRTDMERLLHGFVGNDPVCYFKCPGNAGDSLINSGTLHAFERAGLRWNRVHEDDDVAGRIVFIGGGGNLTGIYDHIEKAFNKFIDAGARQIVVLPHGIRASEDTLRRTRPADIIVCRDRAAFDHVRAVATAPVVRLAHDMAFHLDVQRFLCDRRLATEAEPILRNRLDQHGWSPESIAARPCMTFTRADVERLSTSPTTDIDISGSLMFGEADRESAIAAWCLLACIRCSQRILTDRLHVAIGSALLGVPCELLPNSYDKNSATYDFSLWMYPNITFKSGKTRP